MRKYDLIAFDMDGTLLDSSKRITNESLEAIHAAAIAGKHVALSTGRCVAELRPFMNILKDVRYYITVSGTYIYDSFENKGIASAEISGDSVRSILDIAKPYDQLLQLMSIEHAIEREKYDHIERYHMDQYKRQYEETAHIVDDIYSYYYDNEPPIFKLNLFTPDLESRIEMNERLKHLDLTLVWSEVTGVECTPLGMTKAAGLQMLCDHIGIPIERSIAVGDADNDVEIIRAAGLGIAMGNANKNAKNAADVIVADNDHGGCAEAIYKYLLADS